MKTSLLFPFCYQFNVFNTVRKQKRHSACKCDCVNNQNDEIERHQARRIAEGWLVARPQIAEEDAKGKGQKAANGLNLLTNPIHLS